MANSEGYADPTADTAVKRADKKPEHVTKTIKTLQSVAHWAGVDIVGKIVLRDHKSGREYR